MPGTTGRPRDGRRRRGVCWDGTISLRFAPCRLPSQVALAHARPAGDQARGRPRFNPGRSAQLPATTRSATWSGTLKLVGEGSWAPGRVAIALAAACHRQRRRPHRTAGWPHSYKAYAYPADPFTPADAAPTASTSVPPLTSTTSNGRPPARQRRGHAGPRNQCSPEGVGRHSQGRRPARRPQAPCPARIAVPSTIMSTIATTGIAQ